LSEAFGYAVAEAEMAGLPIIASDVGGVREAVKEASGGRIRDENTFFTTLKNWEGIEEIILAISRFG
jgi:glycosyltransferase involved in cell wall biosynthesis